MTVVLRSGIRGVSDGLGGWAKLRSMMLSLVDPIRNTPLGSEVTIISLG